MVYYNPCNQFSEIKKNKNKTKITEKIKFSPNSTIGRGQKTSSKKKKKIVECLLTMWQLLHAIRNR